MMVFCTACGEQHRDGSIEKVAHDMAHMILDGAGPPIRVTVGDNPPPSWHGRTVTIDADTPTMWFDTRTLPGI